nr:hypothetical protein [Tanacetum cinerariifolium]
YNGLLYEEGRYNYGIRANGFETVGSKDLTCEDWMVNTRTDADLSAAVQNALQTLLPQIRAEIYEEFRTSSGPSDSGGNPPPITIHTWLERFNKQKPHSFEKATAPEKNFQSGLCKYTLNHLMCMPFADVAQVANAARNYEILYERDDDDAERPDKRQKIGDRHQPTTQQSSHRNHGHHNDRHGSDRRGGGDNHRSNNNNYSGNSNRNFGNGRDQRNRGQQSNRSANSGNSFPGVPLRATPTGLHHVWTQTPRRVLSSCWYLLQVWSDWPSAEGLQEEHHCE